MQEFTKERLHEELKKLFVEIFEIEENRITLEAKLYEELELDSIDAIDLIIKCQELTGKRMQPEEFKAVRTVQDVIDVLYETLKE